MTDISELKKTRTEAIDLRNKLQDHIILEELPTEGKKNLTYLDSVIFDLDNAIQNATSLAHRGKDRIPSKQTIDGSDT